MPFTEPISAPDGTRLILIRHGRTEWNATHRVQGQTDAPLDDLGRSQADRMARRLAAEPITAVHSSDLSRAMETARPLAAALALPIQPWPELREMGFGPWEGLTVGEIESDYPTEYAAWRRDRPQFRMEGIETMEALSERALGVGRKILARHGGERIAVVGHGGQLRSLLCAILGWPVGAALQLRMDNAAVTRVEYTAHGPLLVLFNDVAHLDPALDRPTF